LNAEVQSERPHLLQNFDRVLDVRLERYGPEAVAGIAKVAPHRCSADRLGRAQTLRQVLGWRAIRIAPSLRRRTDAADPRVQLKLQPRRLLLDPGQVSRLEALVIVDARQLNGIEPLFGRIVEQPWSFPLEGAKRIAIETQFDLLGL
jgi:hypothetical protein